MKSSLIYAVVLTLVSCSAIAADQATPMADIEPMPVLVPKAAIAAPNPTEEATVQSGSTLDDFSFATKNTNNPLTGDEQNSSQITGSQRQLLHLQEF